MNEATNQLAEVVAKANDIFYSKYAHLDTLMGIMDQSLRKQGMKADVITLDCVNQDKKIVFLIHDDSPELVRVALGNKAGEIFSSSQYDTNTLCETAVLSIMQAHFVITS